MNKNKSKEYDVIIIGGGATGAGTARDCALRGLSVLLVERHDFATGATGRNHGLLHSGARYAVTDHESAKECIEENMILRRIASHCVEENNGLFLTLPEDDIAFQSQFVEACTSAGIGTEIIDPDFARRLEPSVNPNIIGAVKVPDGSVDPFRLTMSNALDARLNGAELLTQHEVTGVIREQDRVVGVELINHNNKEKVKHYAKIVVNAGGIWGHHIANLAGVNINMFPAKGSLLIFGHRVNKMVLNRCRKPANADILVPGDTICLIGTTSEHIPYDQIDNMFVSKDDVDVLIREGVKLSPSLATTRILRAYAGVRPLVAADDDPTGRSISRGIVLLDHQKRDGLSGFITITGGKLMTYRLMAEEATDLICQKLAVDKACETAHKPLPGSERSDLSMENVSQKIYSGLSIAQKSAQDRHGSLAHKASNGDENDDSLVCECEGVSLGEVKYAINELHVNNLIDLRRRTRVGMGTCQGELCACRAAGLLCESLEEVGKAKDDLANFLQERWKGMSPIAWGDTINEVQFTSWIYEGIYGLKADNN
ncbi:anaerobic glycerol-3-phosphate dehydrogenase subunit A [Ancylomarina euxinus]|uniref:Glycerol-3-phosphate dehydrogenase n=1 Tax=Ancylomarina euxinus TaxID=2283627 RepID=A0A425Y520_9BACT|nr:anaerobic glycerol-3-phosphate dehydrogenase subunit A [Ancylomarina euxinus]MCZ4694390.1 anaerobic glycerol-3-phosphate dehydrogenase subunit A [Ancylomarina euxinus]MUP14280.1 anaerobic glycerol-3-phosphate dehydrogenase subunit A [Ancylomarina euxinus]RRG23598.1 anaerobic glycerol-3-phosphate dehydrogenase subunit A [Ancylomarina euxinus]